MSTQQFIARTRVLLSFSSAYDHLARQLTHDLKSANIDVRYDKWEGGGGAPAVHAVADGLDGVAFLLPLLTPSDAARTWIGDEWRRTIYDEAHARGVDVLPVRGEGDQAVVPDFLRNRSFADLSKRGYALELRRLVETIRNRSGDPTIALPGSGPETDSARSPFTLPADPLVLEMGEGVAPLFVGDDGTSTFDEMILMMRDGLFYELGVPFQGPVLRAGPDAPPSSVRVVINDVPETLVEVRPEWVMVNDRVAAMAERGFVAQPAVNPATDAPTAWIPAHSATVAWRYGLTTWDAHEFMILSLSALLRRKAAAFVGINEARAMLERIEPVFPHLVAETVPKTVTFFLFTDVLRRLVAEQVSIHNLRRILMALADWGRVEHDPLFLTEYVRAALKRQITHRLSRGRNELVVLLLHPDIENSIRQSTRHTATGSYVDLEPDRLAAILDAIREPLRAIPQDAQMPQILTTLEIRSSVRRLVAPTMPRLDVVSYQELGVDTKIQPIGRITLDGFRPRPGVSVGGVPLWS